MGSLSISAVGDDRKPVNQIKNNDDEKKLATSEKYIANTRLLTVFDVDDTKGYLSPKELEGYAKLKEEYYVELYDDNGNKIRSVEDIDNDNYLVNDYKDGKRIMATLFNAVTGEENRSEFIFDKNGEEVGVRTFKNRSQNQDIQVEFTEDNKPKKVTEVNYVFDENNNIKGIKEKVTEYEYDENGNVTNTKETVTEKEYTPNKKLDIKS